MRIKCSLFLRLPFLLNAQFDYDMSNYISEAVVLAQAETVSIIPDAPALR
jgi:hypothetical protein